ncbi:geranylgeranylglycerol-phosphate geranylgeranyltransferase [Winogradskyella litorisediminis]|uniref:Geranylgeranylglycerol-phosphate geranylgeranyltransferase n=1 Tax=Winogradskyella litorisediminis TaxID=1156618 RepID=A0ABW3NCT7_9FLAO
MTNFLNLIRWKNLVLIIIAQLLLKYALLEPLKTQYGLATAMSGFSFFLLVFATVCIAAAGYIINDIEDVIADKINKPNRIIIGKRITEKNATTLFIALNFLGVVAGFFLTRAVDKQNLFPIFIVASALLYMYSTFLKRYVLVGNIVIAALVALHILLVGIFDLLPVLTLENAASQYFFLDLIRDYAIFAFMINLLRELVKDIEDIDGDYKMGIQTLPILIGRNRATKTVFFASLIPLMLIIFYLSNNLYSQPVALIYVLLLIIAPMIYASIKTFGAEKKKDYKLISDVLKLVMLTGILSLLLFQFILIK